MLIGLGHQERRLRPLPGEEALGIRRDEDHRHLECTQEVIDRIEARAAVGKLDVGQDQPRRPRPRDGDRFAPRPGDADHPVAEIFDQRLQVERNQRLVELAPKSTVKLGPDIKAKIGQKLRAMYSEVVNQGVPDRFSEILRRLDQADEAATDRKNQDEGSNGPPE